MVGVVERDDGLLAGVVAGDLDRVLDGLGARVEQGAALGVVAGREAVERLGHLDVGVVRRDREAGVRELRRPGPARPRRRAGAELPTPVTAMPEPKSMSELPSTSTSTPPPAAAANDRDGGADAGRDGLRSCAPCSSRDSGPGMRGDEAALLREARARRSAWRMRCRRWSWSLQCKGAPGPDCDGALRLMLGSRRRRDIARCTIGVRSMTTAYNGASRCGRKPSPCRRPCAASSRTPSSTCGCSRRGRAARAGARPVVQWVHSSDLADPTPFLVRRPGAAHDRHPVRPAATTPATSRLRRAAARPRRRRPRLRHRGRPRRHPGRRSSTPASTPGCRCSRCRTASPFIAVVALRRPTSPPKSRTPATPGRSTRSGRSRWRRCAPTA